MSKNNEGFGQLLRSSSNEFRNFRTKSQTKLKEKNSLIVSNSKNIMINKTLTKVNLKNKLIHGKVAENIYHKRTTSENNSNHFSSPTKLKDSYDLYKKFLQSEQSTPNISQKIEILLSFLEALTKSCINFNDIFAKIAEILSSYQKYVQDLETFRQESRNIELEVKNSVFRKDYSKMIRYKANFNNRDPDGNLILNLSSDSKRAETIEKTCPRLSLIKINSNAKLENFNNLQNTSKSKPGIPKIPIPKSNSIEFHEEFMSKLDEFSESWRAEALKMKVQ